MLLATLLALIELGLMLFYPIISISGAEQAYKYNFLECIFLFAEGEGNNFMNLIKEFFNCESDVTAQRIALISLVAGALMILLLIISIIMGLAKKSRFSAILQLFTSIVAFIAMIMTRIVLNGDPNAVMKFKPLSNYFSAAFAIIASVMMAGAILIISRPDLAIGSDKSKNQAARPVMYTTPVVPVQAVQARPAVQSYTAPAAINSPVAPMPAAQPQVQTPPAPAPSSEQTYNCPVCGSQQNIDMPFCTFCGNQNPNSQEQSAE